MKDETSGDPIIEFVGLRPKMYSFLTLKSTAEQEEIKDKHRAKGIDRVASAQLRHADFKKQLEEPVENYLVNRRIGAKLHQIHSIEVFLHIFWSIDHLFCFSDLKQTLNLFQNTM